VQDNKRVWLPQTTLQQPPHSLATIGPDALSAYEDKVVERQAEGSLDGELGWKAAEAGLQ
jgi:hypothetical protein